MACAAAATSSLEDWDRVLRINLTSAMLGTQAIAPLMTEGGSIVNVSSRAGLSGHFTAAYTASKWALRGLSRVASMELGRPDIRVNCLFPGYIDTPMDALRAAGVPRGVPQGDPARAHGGRRRTSRRSCSS